MFDKTGSDKFFCQQGDIVFRIMAIDPALTRINKVVYNILR